MGKRGGARPGAGRKPGAVSKAKKEIASEAKQYAAQALQVLVDVASDRDAPHSSRVSAASALLDRGYGKPHQSQDINTTLDVGDSLTQLISEIGMQGRRITDGDN